MRLKGLIPVSGKQDTTDFSKNKSNSDQTEIRLPILNDKDACGVCIANKASQLYSTFQTQVNSMYFKQAKAQHLK